MYDILYQLVGHEWLDNWSNSAQGYVYQAALALILLVLVVIIDRMFSVLFSFLRGRGVK